MRLHALDVRAVARLAHRERAREVEGRDALEVELVVLAGAQVMNGAAEEAELNAALDEEREVGKARVSKLAIAEPTIPRPPNSSGKRSDGPPVSASAKSTRRPSRGTPRSAAARPASRSAGARAQPARARGRRAARRRGESEGDGIDGSALLVGGHPGCLHEESRRADAEACAVSRGAGRQCAAEMLAKARRRSEPGLLRRLPRSSGRSTPAGAGPASPAAR